MKLSLKKIYTAVSIFITILVILQLFVANKLTLESQKLENLRSEIDKLEVENKHLKSSLASSISLNKLLEDAKSRKFISNPHIINLTDRIPVAAHHQ